MLTCGVFPIDGTPFQQDKAELIVIGSLIDDVASLGGLARSCEIFNVIARRHKQINQAQIAA